MNNSFYLPNLCSTKNKAIIVGLFFSMLAALPAFAQPIVVAPTPTCPSADVISMFSEAYTDVVVDTWLTGWSSATNGAIVLVAGDETRLYENVDFLGIETVANQIDASGMTDFNIDVWTPNMTTFRVKLVNFGPGGNSESEIAFTPTLSGWNTFTIPMGDFTGLTNGTANIGQLILSGLPVGAGTVYIDNVYFSACGTIVDPPVDAEPTVAAPTPTCPSADVISMFSEAYTDVVVDTWLTGWSNSTNGAIVSIAGNDTRLYENVDFLGIETVVNQIDASGMDNFNIDVWTPNMTTFRVKLVNFGPGGNTEHEIAFTPTLEGWNTFTIPMADFIGLTNGTANIGQLILSGLPTSGGTLYIDNVYFSTCAGALPTEPTVAAPTPECATGDVISMFSDAFTDVVVDTWLTGWSNSTNSAITPIAGDDTRLYENVDFFGIETVVNPIDASGMTHFNIDIWTPDMTTFRVKLVDFDAGGTTEGEIAFTPTLAGWNTYSIPMADFANPALVSGPTLNNTSTISQLILSGLPTGGGTLYIDNVYFSGDCAAVVASCDAPANIGVEVTGPTSALFTWDMVPGATLYQVKYRVRGTSAWSKFATAITQRNLTSLTGNKNYQYKVRAFCAEGVWSDYSETGMFSSFYTSNCEAPTGVATVTLDNTSFKVRWDASGEVKGKIRYREVGTTTWLTKNSLSGNNYIYVTGLTADADYEYRVRMNCNDDEWSAYNTLYFHNLGTLEGRMSQELTGVRLYPNPASDVLNITYDNELGTEVTIEVFDMLGRAMISEISNDSQIALNVNQLNGGSYVISIIADGKQSIQKFVKK